jgi:periplasmic mercuric ion binding protein
MNSRLLSKIICFICISILLACSSDKAKQNKNLEVIKTITEGEETFTSATISIEGMTCAKGCAHFIEKKLAKLNGVTSASVQFEENNAIVEYDHHLIEESKIIEEITSLNDGKYSVSKIIIMKTVNKEANNKAEKQISFNSSEVKKTEADKELVSTGLKTFVFPNILFLVEKFVLSDK